MDKAKRLPSQWAYDQSQRLDDAIDNRVAGSGKDVLDKEKSLESATGKTAAENVTSGFSVARNTSYNNDRYRSLPSRI